MLYGRREAYPTTMKWFTLVSLLFMLSCSVIPKNYPANRPFVYDTEINLEGNFNTEQKTDILSRLESQLDDSVRVRIVTKFLFWNYLMNPPAYDSLNASKSVTYMTALLNSLG